MHLVFLTNEYPYKALPHGGIGTFVQNLARNLVKKGISVSVIGITSSDKNIGEELDEGVKIYSIKQSSAKFGKFIFNSFRIQKKIKEINKILAVDIVEGSELSFAFLPKRTFYKKVIRMHGGHHFFAITLNKKTAFWRAFQEKQSFKKADALIAVSNYVGETTQQLLQFKLSFKTIYNFIDFGKFNNENEIKQELNAILFIGTICEKKGVKQLVEAFSIVKKKIPNATLHLVGRDWSNNTIKSYINHIKTIIPLEDLKAIKFYGTMPYYAIPEILAKAHVCVYPSHMESFGLTLVEAMAMHKPIVYSNIPPFNEIITNEVSGLACNPFNSNDIAQKIIKILINKELGIKLSENAKNEVINKFSATKLVKENINFYNSIV
ncbi:glycosyltransferase family 4 protein [Lutibacter sp.]|uniref:glycosyltransferase family 4 protein n=1 Tax=Lutibacter sp. TaxID=1925666 RepID=UPI0025C601F3|nr:glycosyltransferase family 4 protein [Lutibacter sp.]MCF6182660.1 glycosyltransferase family 4 protein [Lutibacter sp.]